jgi:hypothetical protein
MKLHSGYIYSTLKVHVPRSHYHFLSLSTAKIFDICAVTKVITDKVKTLTVQDGQDQKSDWGTTIETELSGDTLKVIKPT